MPTTDLPSASVPSAGAAPASPSPASSAVPSSTPIAGDPPPIALEQVAEGLANPISIAVTPDGWLLVNEQGGRVVAVDAQSGATGVTLDITDRVGSGGSEQGLLGLELHPEWPEQQRAFVHYTDRDGDTVLSEFRVSDEPLPPRLDPTTERVMLQVDQPFENHNGGQVAFGPDGYLYLGLGDGGAGGDPLGHGQNTASLLGKILRLGVDAEGDSPYAIPPDNPFVDGGGAPEIFLYGLRNPWRFSFDRESGQLWIGDVGQITIEEIDRIDPATQAGANLGWNPMEGSRCYVAGCSPEGLTLPIAEYGHDAGCSVTGGYVYRGDALPTLQGWYLFGDYCSGLIFALPSDSPAAETPHAPRRLLESGLTISAFGEGPDGELYLADHSTGGIYRVVAP